MAETTVDLVAVIGMACRLPGGIDSPEQLWAALLRGDDFVTEVPADRWDVDEYYDPEPGVPGRSVSRWGAFLDDVAGFDSEFFGVSDLEATAIDPQHRLLLETAWEAVEHAGLDPAALTGSLTSVFVGVTHDDYALLAADTRAMEGPYGFTGTNFSMASGRIAYHLGLRGPAVTLDTACSSGLMAVHMACRSLTGGESDLAVAGGASVMLEPRKFAMASAQGVLSPTGRCHAFDVAADGFVSGEGSAMVLLKRLSDARRDGDRILAVVRGTAANQDGRTVNIATPSREAQVAVCRAALAAADVDAGTIGMVEAHGTGTPTGDPIEYQSLAQVYGTDGPCALASVKTNFGHSQAAAGPLGLIKAILALDNGVVPQNLHFTRLSDDLSRIATKLFVPQANTPWPADGGQPRRAAVSSYGMSGTNVHAIVEQAPATADRDVDSAGPPMAEPLLFMLSSTSETELRHTSRRLADWLDSSGNSSAPTDLAYTLARRRAHRPVRTVAMASSLLELSTVLRGVADGEHPHPPAVGQSDRGPVWVFSGQGSQWAGMGAGLLAADPVFAAAVAEAEPLIAQLAGFSVTEAMSASETVTGNDRLQPTLFVIQVALATAMRSHGVRPGAVIGHSLGEVAAAVVAGALSLHDGVRVVCHRSRLMSRIAGDGAMASVELPAQQVLSELSARGAKDVALAVVASPQSTVVGGPTESIRALIAAWQRHDVMAREVAIDLASHTSQVDPILAELREALTDLVPTEPTVPFYSTSTYDPRSQPVCNARYWVDNLRQTVRFAAAVQAALEDGHRVFGELAPHPLLIHAVEQNARKLDTPVSALASMRREQGLPHGLRGLLADLHSAGAEVDFSALNSGGRLVDAPLPTWTHRRLLLSRDGQDSQSPGACTVSVHPMLGPHVRLEDEPERHVWRPELGTAAQPWLGDHRTADSAILPVAVYCEMALAAAREVLGEASEARDICVEHALPLEEHCPVGAVASVIGGPAMRRVAEFAVTTNRDGQHTRRANAVLHAVDGDDDAPPAHDMAALLANGHVAEVGVPGPIRSQQASFCVHPVLLNACFDSAAAHPDVQALGSGGVAPVPSGIGRLRIHGSARNARYCVTTLTRAAGAGVEADFDVLDEHGTVLLTGRGLRFDPANTESGGGGGDRLLDERLMTVEWQQRALPEGGYAGAGAWLLVNTADPADFLAATLADAVKTEGAECTTMLWPQGADHVANAQRLRVHLDDGTVSGVVVVTGAVDGDPDEDCARRGVGYVHHLVRIARELPDAAGEPPRLYVIGRNAQKVLAADRPNLEQAGMRGLIRVIGAEYPHLRATQIDVDEGIDAQRVAQQVLSGSDEDETAWRNGRWYTARLCPSPLRHDERRTVLVDNTRDGMRLQIGTIGDVESLELAACERSSPVTGQIEVAVTASSVNFADVLVALGRYPTFDGRAPQLGTDFAGVVTKVGPGVTGHRVGDRVGGLSANGCWGTFLTCEANLAVTLPAGLREDQAAAVTTAHATAWYGLHELARISAGDKVLIHSATGGVGQAAMAMARAVGAEIFATAGSPQRRELLRDIGIEHVYDSRTTDFADLIREDTGGRGVDVVLNSLTGAGQRAGLDLLSFGGRFVEMGKLDIYGDTPLGLFPFRRNLAFYGVDLGLMSVSHPDKVRELLSTVYTLTADGVLPMPQSTHYPLSDAATAIRVMSAPERTGKLVLDVPHSGHTRVVVPPDQARVFRPDGAYIVTGGLGGLGLYLAATMAAAGCGRIVLTSRSVPNSRAQAAIDRIRATGADIHVECGDIVEPETANRMVASATATGLAVRGVLHAAAVIEDATLPNISDELIDRDWTPKVHGAWNLHHATATQPLDWFCSFSSAAALVGTPGQGAYAAANSWLDAFTHWRRAQGLPAHAIAWGPWAEIGRAADTPELGDTAMIRPDEGARAFQALLRHDRAYTGYAPIVGSPWLTAFAQRSRFAAEFEATEPGRTAINHFRAELAALPPDEWHTRVQRLVSGHADLILRRAIDPNRSLSQYGLDSVGGLDLRTRIEAETGIRIRPTEITTVRALARHLSEKLVAELAPPAVT